VAPIVINYTTEIERGDTRSNTKRNYRRVRATHYHQESEETRTCSRSGLEHLHSARRIAGARSSRRSCVAFYEQCPGDLSLNQVALSHSELNEIKRKTREKRKAYWTAQRNIGQQPIEGGSPGEGQSEIVNPGANTEPVFQHHQSDSRNESPKTKNDSLDASILSH
jgi:hypothetical protein